MRVHAATDAWHPQVNGVVRTSTSLARSACCLGITIDFLSPEGFPSIPLPLRVEQDSPDAIHIATEGPIGHMMRAYCLKNRLPFATSYMTWFPEYISARLPIPEDWTYAVLRHFHSAATVTMVSTPSLMAELAQRNFKNLGIWTRGVDTEVFKPENAIDLGPRPIFVSVGRIVVEKNLEAFLSLDLPGSKVVIEEGPQEAELRCRFPNAKFLGLMENGIVAAHLAAADAFVFPSRTDTFGIVQLEALASGIPIAAFPVTGPRDVVGNYAIGVLDDDLREACMGALKISRETCRAFALTRSWEKSALQFIRQINQLRIGNFRKPCAM